MTKPNDEAKAKAVEMTISQIEKQFGKGSIYHLGSQEALEISIIPSGSLSVDLALGTGGYPRGRIVEIFGPESSGKTTLPFLQKQERSSNWLLVLEIALI